MFTRGEWAAFLAGIRDGEFRPARRRLTFTDHKDLGDTSIMLENLTTADADGQPVVYLLVGLAGSGKTTYAQQLVTDEGVVRLSVDELLAARHGRYGIDYPEPRHGELEAPIVAEITERMIELVRAGQSVVLDYGLWRAHERDAHKKLFTDAGGRWRLLSRLADRNIRAEDDGTALLISPSALDDFFGRFDEPHDEGEEILPQR